MGKLILIISYTLFFSGISYNYWYSNTSKTYPVKFKITNVRNGEGNIVLCFFANEKEWKEEAESLRFEVEKDNLKDNELNFTLNLPAGYYGAIILDDENLNDDMDFKMFLPLEGFGFTNFYPVFKPKFNNFKFKVPYQADYVVVKLRYWL